MNTKQLLEANLKLQKLQTKYNRLLAFCAVVGVFMTLLIFFSEESNLHNLITYSDNSLNFLGLGVVIIVGFFLVYTGGLAVSLIFEK